MGKRLKWYDWILANLFSPLHTVCMHDKTQYNVKLDNLCMEKMLPQEMLTYLFPSFAMYE